jgi:antitoxin component of MazEF toxin-antitoxin module
MNKQGKFVGVGNSTGIVIARELLAESGFAQGEEVIIKASPGRIEIEAADDDFERQMAIAREVMQRRRKALRQLAK